jgi:hypothetical protein
MSMVLEPVMSKQLQDFSQKMKQMKSAFKIEPWVGGGWGVGGRWHKQYIHM